MKKAYVIRYYQRGGDSFYTAHYEVKKGWFKKKYTVKKSYFSTKEIPKYFLGEPETYFTTNIAKFETSLDANKELQKLVSALDAAQVKEYNSKVVKKEVIEVIL